jgi:hypothetical protein
MAAGTRAVRTARRLDQDDIRSGTTLMQTVYTVALVVGLQAVIDASYRMFFSTTSGPAVKSPAYLSLVLVAIVLLAVRFFWVPRNLNSYIFHCYGRLGDRTFTRITTVHFPVVLAHALLIYYICQAFLDMTRTQAGLESDAMAGYVTRFTSLYAGLLVLNAAWIRWIMPRGTGTAGPGRIWSNNNFAFAGLALALIAAAKIFGFSNATFIILACITFIANSLIDLWKAAKYYLVYDD